MNNNKLKTYFIVGGFIVAVVIGFFITPMDDTEINIANENVNDQMLENMQIEENKICVYILGAINEPGVVSVSEGTRLHEVIDVAGGVTKDADLQKINLASIVEDEEKIIIPYKISRGRKFRNNADFWRSK